MDTPLIHIILLGLIVVCAVFAVVRTRVIRAAIMLAIISILVTLILFLLGAKLAAIFELSVCAGLITVIFISVIGLTNPPSKDARIEERVHMFKKFVFLPIIILVCGAAFFMLTTGINYIPLANANPGDLENAKPLIWSRQTDLIGQIIILLTGVFGVIVLFKDKKDGDEK